MIFHLLPMRRNVKRNVFNDRKNISATASLIGVTRLFADAQLTPMSRMIRDSLPLALQCSLCIIWSTRCKGHNDY